MFSRRCAFSPLARRSFRASQLTISVSYPELHQSSIMLIQSILWCLLPFAISTRAHAVSTIVEQPTWVDISASSVSSDSSNHDLPVHNPNARDLEAATGWGCGFGWCGDRLKFFNFPKRSLAARDMNAANLHVVQTHVQARPQAPLPVLHQTLVQRHLSPQKLISSSQP
jgi:hypothetical protein